MSASADGAPEIRLILDTVFWVAFASLVFLFAIKLLGLFRSPTLSYPNLLLLSILVAVLGIAILFMHFERLRTPILAFLDRHSVLTTLSDKRFAPLLISVIFLLLLAILAVSEMFPDFFKSSVDMWLITIAVIASGLLLALYPEEGSAAGVAHSTGRSAPPRGAYALYAAIPGVAGAFLVLIKLLASNVAIHVSIAIAALAGAVIIYISCLDDSKPPSCDFASVPGRKAAGPLSG